MGINLTTREKVRCVKQQVEDDLLKIPGVVGVDVGFKVIDGKKTDVLAILIYVEEKKDVHEEHMIPKQIQGIPTDVIQRKFELH